MLSRYLKRSILLLALGSVHSLFGGNQTVDLSPILPADGLPFSIQIQLASFQLPNGFQSGVSANYGGKWLFLAGRTNGLHDFLSLPTNFPPQMQNRTVYVVDPVTQTVYSRSLTDLTSGLTQAQVDLLSVTSPQSHQSDATLYMTGGYGVDQASGQFSTKNVLSAINIPGLMHWVTNPSPGETAAEYIRQISHPIFQVTGGYMTQIEDEPMLLVFGQNFVGFYLDTTQDGYYTKEVRRFRIIDDGTQLGIDVKSSKPGMQDPNYRRRDLNVVPVISRKHGKNVQSLVALSGVFTPGQEGGAWTVPVEITKKGEPSMRKPTSKKAFKQAMNNYVSATVELYSKDSKDMYIILLGGLTIGTVTNGVYSVDPNNFIPFTNQVTTVKIDKHDVYSQYLMNAEYPVIPSTASNPGNPLLFGTGAEFMRIDGLPQYNNHVIKYDDLGTEPVILGYVVGGIQSTLPNTNFMTDSSASPYIFMVTLVPSN